MRFLTSERLYSLDLSTKTCIMRQEGLPGIDERGFAGYRACDGAL
jgi:hypothetical protein